MTCKKAGYSFLFITCIIFLNSCIKKTEAPKPNYGNYTPSVPLWEYCYFKTGSYWVYQDSLSGRKDSVYVKDASVQTYTITPGDNKNYIGVFHHYYTKTIDGIGDTREYDIYDEDAAQAMQCCQGRYFCSVHWNRPPNGVVAGTYFGSYTYMFNNFNSGITGGSGVGEQCWSRGTLPSIQISNQAYNNIVIFENYVNISDANWNVHPYRFRNYISKNFGTIKRIDLDSNHVWLLKNYYVNQ